MGGTNEARPTRLRVGCRLPPDDGQQYTNTGANMRSKEVVLTMLDRPTPSLVIPDSDDAEDNALQACEAMRRRRVVSGTEAPGANVTRVLKLLDGLGRVRSR